MKDSSQVMLPILLSVFEHLVGLAFRVKRIQLNELICILKLCIMNFEIKYNLMGLVS